MDEKELGKLAGEVRRMVYNAWMMATAIEANGTGNARTKAVRNRMSAPLPGDLVAEISTIYGHNIKGVGHLVRIADEPVDFEDPSFVWDEASEGRPHPTEKIFYVRTFAGEVVRWCNANFVAADTHLL